MRFLTLRLKLFLPLILSSVLFAVYAHFVWIEDYITTFLQSQENNTRSHIRTVAEGIVPMLLEDRLATVYDNLDALLEQNPQWVSLTLTDSDHRSIYPLTSSFPRPDSASLRTYQQEVSFAGPAMGYLTLQVDFSDVLDSAQIMENHFHIALVLMLLSVVSTIGLIVELVVRRPILDLAKASSQITKGNYSVALPSITNDEIGDLVEDFNNMRQSLEAYHEKLRGEINSHKKTTKELTEQKELASYQASHDALTGLINRREFERRVNNALELSMNDGSTHVFMYMDLDQFKIVNDTCGHIAGDMLLRQLSVLFHDKMRQHDTLARLGGDEFGILFEYCGMQDALNIAEMLLDTVREYRFTWGDKLFNVGMSIGAAEITSHSRDYFEILSAADSACYTAKIKGRNRVQIYQSEDVDLSRHKGEMLWVTRLLTAFERNEFVLYGQAINKVDVAPWMDHPRYEVLLKIQEHDGSLLHADAFIKAAERYNLVSKIDRWVFENTLVFLSRYRETHSNQKITLSINLSGVSLGDVETLSFIEACYLKYAPPPGAIGIEITETAAIQKLSQATNFMKRMEAHGCHFYLDDFGSGLSSFNYLKSLPVEYVKIDGLFVEDIVTDALDYAMVKSINEICHVMGKKTIAEYVTNADILTKLKEIGVDYAQGFYIGDRLPLRQLLTHTLSKSASHVNQEGNKVKDSTAVLSETY